MKSGDHVNPGYLSFVWVSVLLILLASGWRDILLQGSTRLGLLLLFAAWFPTGFLRVSIGGSSIGLAALFLLALAAAATWQMQSSLQKAHVWCAGLLLGLFRLLLLELNDWTMLPYYTVPAIGQALILAVLTMLMGRGALWQFIAITVGLAAGEGAYVWLHHLEMPSRAIWGAAFADQWWAVFCIARGLTVAAEQGLRLGVSSAKYWTRRWNQREE